MVSLSITRAAALAVFVYIGLQLINAFISANIRQWVSAEGHDRYIIKFAEWVSIRHRGLWLCLAISGAVFVCSVIWPWLPGALPDQNTPKEVSSPQQPANPVPDKKPERFPPTYGNLYPWQITIFKNGLEGMRAELSSKIMIARPHMLQPQAFSRDFEDIAMRIGFEPIVLQQNPAAEDQTGVLVAVPDVDAPSPSALKMQGIIKQLGFEGRFIRLLDESIRQAAPLHANDVGNFAIYVGPSPF
jgi:hypothetical protein